MDKKRFDDAIGEAPPSTVNVDAAIARGRRAARIRPLANPVTAVAVVVLVLLGGTAVALLPGDPDRTETAVAPTISTPTSTWDTPCRVAMGEPADTPIADQLTTVLTERVTDQLPEGAGLVGTHEPPSLRPLQLFTAAPGDEACESRADALFAEAGITLAGNSTTRILVEIDPVEASGSLASWCYGGPHPYDGTHCGMRTIESNEVVQVEGYTKPEARHGRRLAASGVEVTKAEGTVITILVKDGVTAEGKPYPPPLSAEQLTDIALDPRLVLE